MRSQVGFASDIVRMLGGVTGLDGGADTDGFGAKLRFRERVGVFESQGWTNESNGSLNTKYYTL